MGKETYFRGSLLILLFRAFVTAGLKLFRAGCDGFGDAVFLLRLEDLFVQGGKEFCQVGFGFTDGAFVPPAPDFVALFLSFLLRPPVGTVAVLGAGVFG